MRYFIIGYKSSGKSTLGRKLAILMKMHFIDLDEYIEKREKSSIPELYNSLGDEKFRHLEWDALKEVVLEDNIIVSTGGGTPCYCDNMNIMKKNGKIIYLNIDKRTLLSRLQRMTTHRPIVLNKTYEELEVYINKLKQNCEHHYLQADYVISGSDIRPEEVLEIIQQSSN